MKHIETALNNYINQPDTDYAALISGEWGSGKTYFIKNTWKPTPKVGEEKFELINISLYGISNVKEISKIIFAEKNPKTAKIIKYGGPLLKLISRGLEVSDYLSFDLDENSKDDKKITVKQDKINDNIGEILNSGTENLQSKQSIKNRNIILCFDDLERRDAALSLKQIVGYINNFVENGIKVIVLANEVELKEFEDLKEKTFGLSLKFKPTKKESLTAIIEANYKNESDFKALLIQKSDLIFEVFFANSSNLRILKFALSHFFEIFGFIEKERKKGTFKYLDYDELYDDLLRFTLAISIEYRNGNISFENRREIDYYCTYKFEFFKNESKESVFDEEENKKESSEYYEKFLRKYYKKGKTFEFYEFIYIYVTGGDLDNDKLIAELSKIDENIIKPAEIEFKKIPNIYKDIRFDDDSCEMDDETLKHILLNIKEYALKGCYDELDRYVRVCEKIYQYDKAYHLDYSIFCENLLKTLKETVLPSLSLEKVTDFETNRFFISLANDTTYSTAAFVKSIYNLIDIWKKEKDKEMLSKCHNMEDLLNSLEKNKFQPTLQEMNEIGLYNFLEKASNKTLKSFIESLEEIYAKDHEVIRENKKAIVELYTKIDNREINESQYIRNFNFELIKLKLQNLISKVSD